MLRTDSDQTPFDRLLTPGRAARPTRLAVVAHDLRRPAAAALITAAFIDELLDAGASADAVREHTAAIRRCMRHALRITDELTAAAQVDTERRTAR